MKSRSSPFARCLYSTPLLLTFAACAGDDDDTTQRDPEAMGGGGMGGGSSETDESQPCDIPGNIDFDELPSSGSVAFLIADGSYRFIKQPGMTDTSLSFIDSACEYAYGWSRDKSVNDDDAREASWVLDLSTMEFSAIDIPGTSWIVLRGARDDGTVVGKLAIDADTPDDLSDDESRGFIHRIDSGETELVARDGYSDIGFTGIDDEGLVVGFNDFGMQGFVYDEGSFVDLNHDEAFRLFPFQVQSSGTIVGFWGNDEDTWYDNSVSASFIAELEGEELSVQRYELDGYSGTGLTGLNASGQLAGLAYASPTSLPTVFSTEGVDSKPTFYPLLGDFEPFPTGISFENVIHGQLFILEEPLPCAGHGALEEDVCDCDGGFLLDPYDSQNCLPPDAACSGHGHLHGDECHCDEGFKKDPEDASLCVPS